MKLSVHTNREVHLMYHLDNLNLLKGGMVCLKIIVAEEDPVRSFNCYSSIYKNESSLVISACTPHHSYTWYFLKWISSNITVLQSTNFNPCFAQGQELDFGAKRKRSSSCSHYHHQQTSLTQNLTHQRVPIPGLESMTATCDSNTKQFRGYTALDYSESEYNNEYTDVCV